MAMNLKDLKTVDASLSVSFKRVDTISPSPSLSAFPEPQEVAALPFHVILEAREDSWEVMG